MTEKKKILIIEDDIGIQEIFKVYLMDHYNVIESYDGKEGLALIEKEKPDLVVLDLYIPSLSGVNVYKYLKAKEDTKKIPIIVISSGAIPPSTLPEEYMEVEADYVLHKPFDLSALRGMLEKFLP